MADREKQGRKAKKRRKKTKRRKAESWVGPVPETVECQRDEKGRWKPGGPSPNPDGRPRGRTLTEDIREELSLQAPGLPDGVTKQRALAKLMVTDTLKDRNSKVAGRTIDRVDPLPKRIEVSAGGGPPIAPGAIQSVDEQVDALMLAVGREKEEA